ncbi:MAG: peptidylprolyl isomerase [candidate division Zixibacteria bacterium]|nr:peptidylprolyl isomerase [candidate division Zixibacteria bacterium]
MNKNTRLSRLLYAGSVITALLCAVCGSPPPPISFESTLDSTFVVARAANDVVVTNQDVFAALKRSELVSNGGTVEASEIQAMLDSVILDTLAGLDVISVDLIRHYHDYRLFQQSYYDKLIDAFWEEVVNKKVTADSSEAIQFYHEHKELFSVKEQVDLYHILVSWLGFATGPDSLTYRTMTREQLEAEAKELAFRMHRLIDSGEYFENVAYTLSHDISSREKGGHIGWTGRGVYLDPFDSVAFLLKEGEHSLPYQDADGWHLIKVASYLPEGPVPIDSPQVYESARLSLLTTKANIISDSIIDSLRLEVNVAPNPAILDTNIYFVHDTVWAGVVNGVDTIDSRRMKELEENFRARHGVDNTDSTIKKEMLAFAAERWLLVQVARSHGIDTLPYMKERWKSLWHHRSKAVVMRRATDPDWSPSEAQIEKHYKDNLSRFVYDKPLTFDLLTVNDSTMAAFFREQLLTGLEFSDLVEEYGKQPEITLTVEHVANVGQEDIPREVYNAALQSRIGTVSRPFKSNKGHHLLKLIEHNQSRTFMEAKGTLLSELQRQHRSEVWQKYRDDLFRRYSVTFPGQLTGSMAMEPRWTRLPRER